MAQRVLTWPISQGKVWSMQFHVYLHVFESEFASGVKDMTFVLIYICVENGRFYSQFVGGFIMFLRYSPPQRFFQLFRKILSER